MHIRLVAGIPQPYSLSQLRWENPQVSFPKEISAETLAEYGVYKVQASDPPEPNPTQVVTTDGYLQLADNSWVVAWKVRPMTTQELEHRAKVQEEERRYAYQQEADPLFFKWQRGDSTEQAWRDKVAEIKARIPG